MKVKYFFLFVTSHIENFNCFPQWWNFVAAPNPQHNVQYYFYNINCCFHAKKKQKKKQEMAKRQN